ncbi:glycosyltransferase family 2 protein [Turicibacter sanguinis]|uniref:glycosyltransferase family 2 protein n=1 Tax=Turicibacter sanguinis TaxID=154288 RepID=UPI001E52CBAA|nr:glycosyltransferase family 2 protein [Turicibacter sanguinis]MDB8558560.1 glycosyltransferase family 2 protein [Turicibacter sanguinis]MDB8561356.1 glycosyltransferase family 2 protein [Turicibacter sanguinis]
MEHQISIIIPVYNVEQYLQRCLTSVLNQTYKKLQIIVVNDGTKDNSQSIIDEFVKQDSRIISLIKENGGLSDARNYGLDYVTGEYIFFLDSDDYLELNAIELLYKKALETKAELVVGYHNRIFENKASYLERNFKYQHHLDLNHAQTIFENKEIIVKISNSAWGKLYKSELFLKTDIRYPKGLYYEDLATTFRILATGCKVIDIKENIYNYIIRPGSYMTSGNRNIYDMFKIFNIVIEYYKNHHIYNDFKEELDYLMIHHIGIGTMYRGVKSKSISNYRIYKECCEYMKKQQCNISKNQYTNNYNVFVKLYLTIYKFNRQKTS